MNLNHKNTSKWVKRVLKHGLEKLNEGNQATKTKKLYLNTLLRKKIHSMNEGSRTQ